MDPINSNAYKSKWEWQIINRHIIVLGIALLNSDTLQSMYQLQLDARNMIRVISR